MSVIIKGMKMPEDCFSCQLKEEGYCNLTNDYAGNIYKRNNDCPLMEAPEPCEDAVSRKAAMLRVAKVNPVRFKSFDDFHDACVDCLKELPSAQPDYKTDHGYMWLCPKCGLEVHSDFVKCPRCGLIRHDTQQEIGITRCMYCKNWIPGYITDNDEFIPPKCGKYQQMVGHNHNDFCSLAERRENA